MTLQVVDRNCIDGSLQWNKEVKYKTNNSIVQPSYDTGLNEASQSAMIAYQVRQEV